jgi:tetratricopeptide (TPR) repeat protein
VNRGAALASALALVAAGGPRVSSADEFWDAGDPTRSAYAEAMAAGDALAAAALQKFGETFHMTLSYHRRRSGGVFQHTSEAMARAFRESRVVAVRAADAYERAAAADPSQEEPHYRAARVLEVHFIDKSDTPDPAQTQRALDHWYAFERLAPLDPRLPDMLFHRSLALTKLGGDANYERAIADYERELRLVDVTNMHPDNVANRLTNRAEVLMALGRLDEAIALYRQGLAYRNEALYAYGLAVALDRDNREDEARRILESYVPNDFGDGQPMRSLRASTVFFIPAGDEHYYYALGYEALGRVDEAIGAFEQYLQAAGKSRYAGRAREHLRDLRRRGVRSRPPRASGAPER